MNRRYLPGHRTVWLRSRRTSRFTSQAQAPHRVPTPVARARARAVVAPPRMRCTSSVSFSPSHKQTIMMKMITVFILSARPG